MGKVSQKAFTSNRGAINLRSGRFQVRNQPSGVVPGHFGNAEGHSRDVPADFGNAEGDSEIESEGIQQEKDLSGITTNKDHTLVALADRTIEFAGAVHSNAIETGDYALMSRVDYKPSVLL